MLLYSDTLPPPSPTSPSSLFTHLCGRPSLGHQQCESPCPPCVSSAQTPHPCEPPHPQCPLAGSERPPPGSSVDPAQTAWWCCRWWAACLGTWAADQTAAPPWGWSSFCSAARWGSPARRCQRGLWRCGCCRRCRGCQRARRGSLAVRRTEQHPPPCRGQGQSKRQSFPDCNKTDVIDTMDTKTMASVD